MPLSRNLFLCYKHFIANRAMFAFGLAGCGASSFNSFVDYFRMPLGRDNFLCNKNLIADGAVFTLSLAGCGAGSFNSIINDFGVTLGGDFLNSGDRCAADRAFDARRMTGFRAGGRLFSNINERMTGCIKHFGLGFAANSTSVSLDTGIAAGRGSRNYALVPAVTLRRNLFLCNKNLVADRAVFTLGQTSLRAGRSLCCIDYFCVAGRRDFFHTGENRITNGALRTGCMASLGAGCGLLGNFNGSMTGSIDCFGFGFVANRAGVGLDTGIFTSRSGRDLALIPLVSLRGNFLHAGESLAADRAFFAGFMTSLGAGCGLLGNFNGSMTGSIDCFGFGFVANRAGVGLDAGIFTGRSGRDLALVPAVSRCGNHCLCHENLIADRAMFAFGLAGFGAGRLNRRINDYGVSLGGNSLAGAYFLAAILAVGIAGVAWLGAGCFLGITKFCVLMCARRAAPYAFDIVDNIASLGSLRLGVRAVGVVQLGGGDGDGHRIIPVRIILIGRGFFARCALLNIFAGSVAGADIRAALGGVDSTDSLQAAVYIHLGILQVCIGAVIGFTGCIRNRLELARTPDKVIGVPFIAVINVDIFSTGDRQVSTLGNAHLNTSQ